MCKQIYIVDQAKQDATDSLAEYVDKLKRQFATGFDRCLRSAGQGREAENGDAALICKIQEYPQSDELVSTCREQMLKALDELCPVRGGCKNANMVGSLLKGVFAWAEWNGFWSIAGLRTYMDDHPSAHLEDEEGTIVLWPDFVTLALSGVGG